MTPLLLHGLQATDAPAVACDPGAPALIRVEAAGLRALCTPAPDWLVAAGVAPDRSDPDGAEARTVAAALAHDRLLRAALSAGAILPVRFGTLFSGAEALRDALCAGASGHRARLARVAGAVERGLHLAPAPGAGDPLRPAPDSATGRDFLRSRKGQRDRREGAARARRAWIEAMVEGLADLARETLPRPPRRDRVLDLALLVPACRDTALAARVEAWAGPAAAVGLTLSLTDPMPPYSFAQAPAEAMADPGRAVADMRREGLHA